MYRSRIFALLAWACIGLAAGAQAQDSGSTGARAGWYLAAGGGWAGSSSLDQEGWNRDDLCYPDMACFGLEPPVEISGYRWRYGIGLDDNALFELAAGRYIGRARVELAVGQQRNNANQKFAALSFYDGSPVAPAGPPPFPPPPEISVDANSRASIDRVNTRYVALDAYYDFPNAWGRFSPYLGAGLGRAQVEIAGLHYSSDYQDTGQAAFNFQPALPFYNSVQNADLRDDMLLWRLHAGADFRLSSHILLGVKLTWSGTRSFEASAGYETHAQLQNDPGFSSTNAFSGMRNWSAAVTVKRLLGN
ncbi:MAG: outer membrane beta-barrel protein [Gammaproteobacteria bacterium]|nr:outer membrane beta-barrel protein [Gammaproteobacteria bacterium]MYD02562.1 outer membrane beta-barrel protein [Gammaproteobacteria bacterium]MYI25323.1 outer membrane beta-barrel protein [Gammaproteobacteria bacterium]